MKHSQKLLKNTFFIFAVILFFTITLATNNFTLATSSPINNYIEYKSDTNLNISSNSVILIDSNTGAVLYSKNAEQASYPASTTKIMTALLTLEKVSSGDGNLTDMVAASYSATSVIPAGYSSAYLSVGEEITIEQLLEVLLIHSANDAANVLAEYVSGSIEAFVDLMNDKAEEIGCTNTHFINTNGIHDENHYTTAYDLALIFRYCLNNENFRRIISMESCTIPATNKSAERIYTNTNSLINKSSKYYYSGCIGGKTGYTSQAKNCLVSACSKDGLELIAVILGAPQVSGGSSTRYADSTALYDYGYSTYSISTIANKSDIIYTMDVPKANSETKSLDLLLENDVSALVKTSLTNDISYCITLKEDLSAPLAANSIVGTVTYTINDITYTENLIAAHNVEKSDILLAILRAILTIILLIIIFFILFRINKFNRNLRKRRLSN